MRSERRRREAQDFRWAKPQIFRSKRRNKSSI
jgi:hypothetical protein